MYTAGPHVGKVEKENNENLWKELQKTHHSIIGSRLKKIESETSDSLKFEGYISLFEAVEIFSKEKQNRVSFAFF